MRKKKESPVFTIIILLFFGLLTCAGTLVVFYVFPLSTLTCEYIEPDQVDCQLQEKAVGLLLLREKSINRLKEAYVISEIQTRRERGSEVETKAFRLQLRNDSDTITLDSFDEVGGILVQNSADKINNFLRTPTDETLQIRQATWVPLLVSIFFFLVSILLLYVAADTLVRTLIMRSSG